MQVNNNHSPNFGMALRISPSAKGKLQKESLEYLSNLRKAGEELKGHKYVDVDLGENLSPVVNRRGCANAYKDFFKPVKLSDDAIEVETRWAGNEVGGMKFGEKYTAYLKFANAKEAAGAYESLQKANERGTLASAVEFAKAQEKSSAHRAFVEEQQAQLQARVNEEVEKLMNDFPNIDA